MELLTPKPEESLKFFVLVMGMTATARAGDSVYLRGWDDYEHHTLKLTASKTSGMGHMAFRAHSPQALERRVAALKKSGHEIGWSDGDLGHGPAFQFHDPDGHKIEIYYETEWYKAPPELRPALKNQAMRFPARGVNVRRLDHLNCLAVDIKANRIFFEEYLGCRLTEQIVMNDGSEAGMWLTVSRRHFSRERRVHRDGTAQARRPANIFSLRLRARRQPRGSRQRRRAPDPRPGLEAHRVDRRGTQEGPGVGAEDDRVVSHVRHASGRPTPLLLINYFRQRFASRHRFLSLTCVTLRITLVQ
jgi:catechol 2,3-dioxygenase-like lactoylglutathione lyase family enzyme